MKIMQGFDTSLQKTLYLLLTIKQMFDFTIYCLLFQVLEGFLKDQIKYFGVVTIIMIHFGANFKKFHQKRRRTKHFFVY